MDLNVFIFPFISPGHMIPMVDLAQLFAIRGAKVTIITTEPNAPLIQPTIDITNTKQCTHRVQLLCITALPTSDLTATVESLEAPFARLVEAHHPNCVVADKFFPWATSVCGKLGIPSLCFYSTSVFSNIMHGSLLHHVKENARDEHDMVVVPGLPHRVEMAPSQLPEFFRRPLGLVGKVIKGMEESYGVIVNSFCELESDYVEMFRECNANRKVWLVGPLSIYSRDMSQRTVRGNKEVGSVEHYMQWLDTKRPRSVVYVCFGSQGRCSAAQLTEIAHGLEASHYHFIWVISSSNGDNKSLWMPEGLEERLRRNDRGLVVHGWAPQLLILGHEAVGCFVTHCGWNSSIEGIAAGVPLITWPLFAEQFLNEKLIVDVLGIGVAVGALDCSLNEEERTMVKVGELRQAIDGVMGSSEEAEERRRRAAEVGVMARKAMEKGGSSYRDMDIIVEELASVKASRLII